MTTRCKQKLRKSNRSLKKGQGQRGEPISAENIRFCQIVVHPVGLIELNGDKETVDSLVEKLERSSFRVQWSYKSRCG